MKVHLARLVSLELVHAHRGAHGAFVYELAWDSADAGADGVLLPGLIDPDQHGYDPNRSGSGSDRSGGGRPAGGWPDRVLRGSRANAPGAARAGAA